jgi:hypothetical protein
VIWCRPYGDSFFDITYDITINYPYYFVPDLCYLDGDGDGYGDPDHSEPALAGGSCSEGYVEDNTDCDDDNPAINPDAQEVCNGEDDDCDGEVDEDLMRDCNTVCGNGTETCENGEWVNCTAPPPPCDVEFEMNLSAGWSMISLPVEPTDIKFSAVFPEAAVMFRYEKKSGYVRVQSNETLQVGTGYWILMYQDQNYRLIGQQITSYIKTVYSDGWEMTGGCTSEAKPSMYNCNIKEIYGYVPDIGYKHVFESESFLPGQGYWILLEGVADQCELIVEENP